MYTQSPSIQDLLSARSKAQTLSIYSTLTTHTTINTQLDTSTHLPADISETARRAMAEEASNGLWSPSMESSAGDHEENRRSQAHFIPPPSPDPTEGSDYSPSLSVASVRIVSRVPTLHGDPGNVPTVYNTVKARRGSIDMLKGSIYKNASQPEEQESSDLSATNPAVKRVLNARNLAINTQKPPQQLYQQGEHRSVTPDPARSRYAHLDLPLTSRSLPPSQAPAATPTISAFPNSAPLSAVPAHVATITAASHARRRSSQGSYSSSVCLSPVDDENVTSLQRMQSFLGPKMKHISPAPWQLDPSSIGEGNEENESAPSETSFWNDEDFEIGSVQMATKTPRSRSVREALGLAASTGGIPGRAAATKADLSVLRGLGLAIDTKTAAQANIKTDELPTSSAPTSSNMPRSFSKDSIRPQPLSASSAKTSFEQPTMTVSNIVRTRSPDPTFAAVHTLSDSSRTPLPTSNVDASRAAHLARRRSITAEASFSSSLPDSSTPRNAPVAGPSTPPEVTSTERPRRVDAIPRKRPPLVTKDSGCSVQTTATSHTKPTASPSVTSLSSLPSPTPKANESSSTYQAGPNGLKLISLDAAREREKDRIGNSSNRPANQAPSTFTHSVKTSLPPLPAAPSQLPQQAASQTFSKAVKSKKSGFLKLFKQKDDSTGAPVHGNRSISPDLPSPMTTVRTVSNPVDNTSLPYSSLQAAQQPVPEVVSPRSVLLNEASRKANVSAPPTVTFAAPSPDTVDIPVFPDPPTRPTAASHQKKPSPIALAPSLSLRPVSMMISSMPQDFLANLSAIESKKRGAISEGSRTPDTASFVFLDASTSVTPPGGTPVMLSSSAPTEDTSKTAYGLPTPPHSANSSRTFSAPNLSTKAEAAYQAKIIDLEKLVMTLKVELDAAQQSKDKDSVQPQKDQAGQSAGKVCDKCGCTCRTVNSVLARPRVIGHGNMFSSGRD